MASKSATPPSYALRPGVMFPDWSVVVSPKARDALSAMIGTCEGWGGYDSTMDHVRVTLLKLYGEEGKAPTPCALADRTGLSSASIQQLLQELAKRDLIVCDGPLIVGAYPFTDRDTGHRVSLGGRILNAMCAVDALGIAAMTGQDTAIASPCRHCAATIRIATQDQGKALAKVEPRAAVMWQSVQCEGDCAANSLCAATAFFCSDEHLSAWRRECAANEPGFRLSINEALEVGRALFGPSLRPVMGRLSDVRR